MSSDLRFICSTNKIYFKKMKKNDRENMINGYMSVISVKKTLHKEVQVKPANCFFLFLFCFVLFFFHELKNYTINNLTISFTITSINECFFINLELL